MKKYYKRQETIEGIFYSGTENPPELFPEDMPLVYKNKSKAWFFEDNLLQPGFYWKDGWGKWKWIHPQAFVTLYDDLPYALDFDK